MKKELYIIIGKNIQKYRQKKGYSIKQLSELTNIDTKKLEKYETKGVNGNINFYQLNIICNSLDIELKELVQK